MEEDFGLDERYGNYSPFFLSSLLTCTILDRMSLMESSFIDQITWETSLSGEFREGVTGMTSRYPLPPKMM